MLKLADEGVIYARVSSAKQVAEGNGLQSQISACKYFARENDIKIIKVFQDPEKSGKDLIRPGLRDLLSFLEQRKKLTYVIFDDISRLTRNNADYYPLKALIVDRKGIPKDLKNNINDDGDPLGAYIEHSMVGFADLQRRLNKQTVIERQTQRLMAGIWVYPAPIGYTYENKELQIEADRAPFIRKIFKDFAAGRYSTYKEIKDSDEAKLLINPKSNTSYRFKDDSVKRLLTNNSIWEKLS